MSCSRALKWGVAPLLLLTLGWKWVVSSNISASSEPEEEQIAALRVAEFLERNYFHVVQNEKVVFGMQLIEATAGDCRLRVVVSASRGWHRDLISKLTKPTDHTFVDFGGTIYAEQPMWRTVPDFLWWQVTRKLGFESHPTPVITVMADPNCDAERLPWSRLQ